MIKEETYLDGMVSTTNDDPELVQSYLNEGETAALKSIAFEGSNREKVRLGVTYSGKSDKSSLLFYALGVLQYSRSKKNRAEYVRIIPRNEEEEKIIRGVFE